MTIISIILTIVALVGTWLNANQNKSGFVWWIISNTGWGVYNFAIGQYALSVLFFVYLLLAIKGLKTWK